MSVRSNLDFYILFAKPQEKLIACYLTDNLDENGYLTDNLSNIAQALQCAESDVSSVLEILYKCDPVGVYSTNLKQCLARQLIEKNILDDKLSVMLENLDLIASNDFKKLARLCKISSQELQEMLAIIRSLDPKPGRNFSKEIARVMMPDIYIRKDNDKLIAVVDNSSIPQLTINSSYFNRAIGAAQSKEDKQYCLQILQQASNLIKAVSQRNRMLFRAVEELIIIQEEFFLRGIKFLKPMTYKELAGRLDVHESTVSRLANKIVATPVGTYELKYFFSTGFKASFMENEYSSKTVKLKIKQIIDDEADNDTLSDMKLTKLLNADGIMISRRTVTKYREAMNIQTAAIRRRQKLLKSNHLRHLA